MSESSDSPTNRNEESPAGGAILTTLSWVLVGLGAACMFWAWIRFGFNGGRYQQFFEELGIRLPAMTETALGLRAWGTLLAGLAPIALFSTLAVVLQGGGRLSCATLCLLSGLLFWAALSVALTLPLQEVRHMVEQNEEMDPAEKERYLQAIDELL